MNTQRYTYLFLFILIHSSVFSASTYYASLGNTILSPFQQITHVKITHPTVTESLHDRVKKVVNPEKTKFTIPQPSLLEQERLWFGILADDQLHAPTITHTVLGRDEIEKLDLVAETVSGNNNCLLNKFPTCTVFGKTSVAEQLMHPLVDTHAIMQKQEILRKLTSNSTLHASINESLNHIKQHQWAFFSFFQSHNDTLKQSFSMLYFQNKGLNKTTPALAASRFYQSVNTKPHFMPFRAVKGAIGTGIVGTTALTALCTAGIAIDRKNNNQSILWGNSKNKLHIAFEVLNVLKNIFRDINQSASTLIKVHAQRYLSKRVQTPFMAYLNNRSEAPTVLLLAGAGIITSILSLPFVYASNDRSIHAATLNYMKQKLTSMAHIVTNLEKLQHQIDQSPQLKVLPELRAIKELLETQSPELRQLLRLLKSDTFFDKGSCITDSARILAAYNLMNIHKTEFIGALKSVGTLDALCAVKQLQNSQGYCFVHFATTDRPYIEAQEFWNPLMHKDAAITNNVHIGNTGNQHMIITGPNGSGKSVFIKGLTLALILAQTFGITSAKQMTIDPVSIIRTYLNVHEDLHKGISTFMAEQQRLAAIIQDVQALRQGQKAFVIIDEPLKGTVEQSGGPLVRQTLQKLNQSNTCTLLATHFETPATLAQQPNANFENYYIALKELPNGEFKRTFKCVQGIHPWWFGKSADATKKREEFIDWLHKLVPHKS